MKRIALAQMNIEYGNYEKNVAVIKECLSTAIDQKCDVVLMPELCSSGFDLHHVSDYPSKNLQLLSYLQDTANKKRISIGGSFIVSEREKFYNSFRYIQPEKTEAVYHKNHLFALMHEDRYFSPGSTSIPFDSTLGKSGAAICYDLRFPSHFSELSKQGVEFFFLPAHWPISRISHWDILLQARAIENQAFMIAVNSVGKSGKDVYGGHSMIIAPDGEIVLQAPDDEEGVYIIEIDTTKASRIRKEFPMTR